MVAAGAEGEGDVEGGGGARGDADAGSGTGIGAGAGTGGKVVRVSGLSAAGAAGAGGQYDATQLGRSGTGVFDYSDLVGKSLPGGEGQQKGKKKKKKKGKDQQHFSSCDIHALTVPYFNLLWSH